jgi:hypothetical protein
MHHLMMNLPVLGTLGVVALLAGPLARLPIDLGAWLLEMLARWMCGTGTRDGVRISTERRTNELGLRPRFTGEPDPWKSCKSDPEGGGCPCSSCPRRAGNCRTAAMAGCVALSRIDRVEPTAEVQ